MIRVGLYIAGFKGYRFLQLIHTHCAVKFVVSYPVKGTLDDSYQRIKTHCREHGYPFVERVAGNDKRVSDSDLVFVIGWQYLLHSIDDRYVVFHDSLLPQYRGFAPTVAALIAGDRTIGATAFRPARGVDTGPVFGQARTKISYPMKIADALQIQSEHYAKVARELIARFKRGRLRARRQDDSKATYSIWRDQYDYFIDWTWSADKINRFVDAVGWPYEGARTIYRSRVIIIDEATVEPEMKFSARSSGKIWAVDDGAPLVICGAGILRIRCARYDDGEKVAFRFLRERLGNHVKT